MASDKWVRVLDTLGTLRPGRLTIRAPVRATRQGALNPPISPSHRRQALGALGALETRLAGVLVAALKEAFDRDKARMDLERETVEAERGRAERALAGRTSTPGSGSFAEPAATDRGVRRVRAARIGGAGGLHRRHARPAGRRSPWAPAGPLHSLRSAACLLPGRRVSSWAASTGTEAHRSSAADAAPWLLLLSLALTAASLLMA